MTEHHPITPPPELVQQWAHDINDSNVHYDDRVGHNAYEQHIATCAAQWGADQELEACCEWLKADGYPGTVIDLRAARRPKPPSFKELACAALDAYIYGNPDHGDKQNTYNTIRRALEALPND